MTNETSDRAWLSPLALPATAVLERPCEAVADLGYDHGAAVQACLEAGITPSIARPITAANKQLGLFSTEDVRYDGATDTSLLRVTLFDIMSHLSDTSADCVREGCRLQYRAREGVRVPLYPEVYGGLGITE